MKATVTRPITQIVSLFVVLWGLALVQTARALNTPLSVAITSSQGFVVTSTPLGGTSGCNLIPATHYYDTKAIVVSVDGDYTFTATSASLASGASNDSFLALYSASFDPAAPTVHLRGCNDDSVGLLPSMTLTGLTNGQVYVLLNTTFAGLMTGTVDLTVSGPGIVTVVDKPTVTTQAATNVATITATGNGTISDIGGRTVYERGICWGTTLNPDISGSKVTESGSFGTGPFTGSINGLNPATTYHFRAYATNPSGTSYGADTVFVTMAGASVPTLSEWGMIAMMVLLMLAMAFVMHRQNQAGASE